MKSAQLRKGIGSGGFTLIELLIVIAVLGVLAVAVLSAINPIEQINRAKDNASKQDAEQLIGAFDRFYATKGFYPWQADNQADPTLVWTVVDGTWTDGTDSVLDVKLSGTGAAELKQSFVTRVEGLAGTDQLHVYNSGATGDSTYVCYVPKSAAGQEEAASRCGGTLPSDFPAADACATTDGTVDAGNNVCLP